jgi:hypothetical protein
LTGADRDVDRILITGSCLTGKAECWFSQEVERPTRLIRDWTFESVIIGLYRTFITTATAQQAMQRYTQVRFSRDEGVTGFHSDLMLWAGRLAQFPDIYSFKRRLLNGLPFEYRQHLALYDGITAEHSSIDEILLRARRLERTLSALSSIRSSRGSDRNTAATEASPPRTAIVSARQRDQRQRNTSTKQPQGRIHASTGSQIQRSAAYDRGNTSAPVPAAKGDTSKLTCFKCGKIGHIATDPKCPQYKKPEQRRIFAAQVIDDRPEADLPANEDGPEDQDKAPGPETEEIIPDEDRDDLPDAEDHADGSQYESDASTHDAYGAYDDFEGYALPSEDEEPIYIRAMHEQEPSASPTPPHFDDIDWQSRRTDVRTRYRRAPWMPHDAWEFSPNIGVTHVRGCDTCAHYKEHLTVAGALREEQRSLAWETRDKFERDLIHLGWILAQEGGRIPPGEANLLTLRALNASLEQQIHELTRQIEAVRRVSDHATARCNELSEALECERLDVSLRAGEADFWLEEYQHLQGKYRSLEDQLTKHNQREFPDKDLPGSNEIPLTHELRSYNACCDDSQLLNGQTRLPLIGENSARSGPEPFDLAVDRMAAIRENESTYREREFRSAQRRNYERGERPRTSGDDRRCMAALVKVNGLEAYALLDTGSTTVSITNDFARVARIGVQQLDNPVTLQLGTVGSRSMINFGARARIELGPIMEANAYIDVVNIDRYDMIIGTPFMRRHKIVLDFSNDTLSAKGHAIQTMTAGQEDLMLAKKRASRSRTSTTVDGRGAHASL